MACNFGPCVALRCFIKAGTAKDIFEAIRSAMCSFGRMSDDLTIAVVRRL